MIALVTDRSSYSEIDLRNQFHLSDETVDDPCIPRYQLTRIKHSQTFSGVYLLQVTEIQVMDCTDACRTQSHKNSLFRVENG